MADSWLQRFEERLGLLERQVDRSDASFTAVTNAVRDAVAALGDVRQIEIWLTQRELIEQLFVFSQEVVTQPDDVRRYASLDSHFLTDPPTSSDEGSRDSLAYVSNTSLAENIVCSLIVEVDRVEVQRANFADGIDAIHSILNIFVSRHLLTQYESRFANQMTLVSIVSRLHECSTLKEAAGVVVQDGAALIDNCRLSIAATNDGHAQIIAMTGVREPQPEAETVRALCRFIESHSGDGDWVRVSAGEDSTEHSEILNRCGVRAIRCIAVSKPTAGAIEPSRSPISLTVETFADETPADESTLQQLISVASPVLVEKFEREQSLLQRLIRNRSQRKLVVFVGLLAALVLLPARFEIEVDGQLFPTNRRRIFAPEDGTVDRIMFRNESEVSSGETLLLMSNADLDLTQRQLEGRISTSVTELASIESQRLVKDDPDLSRQQKQLSEEIENLRKQLQIVVQQVEGLSVSAPFDGRVFRSDAEQELLSRPVQRGQLLLEIVPRESTWQLNLQIPDRLRDYVVEHQGASENPPKIRYLVVSSPERDWTTSLKTVDNAIQIADGKLICRATAELDNLPDVDLKPGTSVVARIDCGRRSLGFVLFRELIEFWWWLKFAWL